MTCVLELHLNATLPKVITTVFIAIIPKTSNPQGLNDFCHICLIGCVYCILEKLLEDRIKKVIGSLISSSQSTFIQSRQMLDGVLVINEVMKFSKREKNECLMFKVYFEKAYDCIAWEYLRDVMQRMGFGRRWMRWMEACVFSSSMPIFVNGSPTKYFQAERGLRQGNPLSSFLFLITTEGLKGLVQNATM